MRVFKGKIKSICNVTAYALFGKMTLRYKDAKKSNTESRGYNKKVSQPEGLTKDHSIDEYQRTLTFGINK